MISDDMIGIEEDEDTNDWVKVPLTAGLDQSSAEVCVSLRHLQHRRGCSNVLLEDILDTMRPYLRVLAPRKYTEEDKKMQREAGVESMALDGCTGCDFIFLPKDSRDRCPSCGESRYLPCGEPKERVWYFPIGKRLSALMQLKSFSENINYEKTRPEVNPRYITDIYDTACWKQEIRKFDADFDKDGKCHVYLFDCTCLHLPDIVVLQIVSTKLVSFIRLTE